ncbi:unnamed protein product [Schistocephalus solidus]|uniref:Uncharacterized protein n=1 Tax=Schistocephalus solidus TaxID=70667 RepID=A0A183S8G8_SCHSO|nr:unnamed protein product [Schistocephalus solidus]
MGGTPPKCSKPVLHNLRRRHQAQAQSNVEIDLPDQITQQLDDLRAQDDKAIVERRGCPLRKVIRSTALEVLGRGHRHHQDWFDDNDADVSNLLTEKNGLYKAYIDLRTDATKATFLRCYRIVN